MKMRNVVLDCDPGHDDAIAIMLTGKSKHINLLGISVVTGNQTIEKTGVNALNVCQYLDINVPVALGADKPLIKERVICDRIHGESGLDGFIFPPLKKSFDKRDGTQLIIDLIKENDKASVITTGPLTNLALALKKDPSIIPLIDEVIIMGGSIGHGNVTPAAEFNINCDPEAADIVFNSGLKIKMVGLDVTRQVLVLPQIMHRFKKIHNKAGKLFIDLMKVFNRKQKEVFGFEGAPLHDPATIVSLIDDKVIRFQSMNVEIDVSKGCSYGRTNCDQFNYLNKKHNAEVAVGIDVEKYWDVIEKVIKEYE